MMESYNDYFAQAATVSIENISSDSDDQNLEILRRLKRNDPDVTKLHVVCYQRNRHWSENNLYVASGAYELGWLGYFIGCSTYLQELRLDLDLAMLATGNFVTAIKYLCEGINHNTSIQKMRFNHLSGGSIFQCLDPFFRNNKCLSDIELWNCNIGREGGRLLSLAIAGCNPLRSFTFEAGLRVRTEDISFADIIVALSMHPNLEELIIYEVNLGSDGCTALATLLKDSTNKLRTLKLCETQISDVGMESLAPGIASCCNTLQCLSLRNNSISDIGADTLSCALAGCSQLQMLNLTLNRSITSRGWQSVSSLLRNPNFNLEDLELSQNDIGDEVATMFATALVKNKMLKKLFLEGRNRITAEGWAAFSKLMCDTSSVTNTFLSNHTLEDIIRITRVPREVLSLLDMNKVANKKKVATIKILKHHHHFDMKPLFEWDLKTLPLVMGWFDRAEAYSLDFEAHIGNRKLSSIYQFIRGMPIMYVKAHSTSELDKKREYKLKLQQELFDLSLEIKELEFRNVMRL